MADPKITIIDSGLKDSDGRLIPIGVEGDISTLMMGGMIPTVGSSLEQRNLGSLLDNKDGILTDGFRPFIGGVGGMGGLPILPADTKVGRGFLGLGREDIWSKDQLLALTEDQIPVFKFANGKWQVTGINIGDTAQQDKTDIILDSAIQADPKAMEGYKKRVAPITTKTGQVLDDSQLPLPPQTPKTAGITGASVEDWIELGFTEAEAEKKVRQGTPFVSADVKSLADDPLLTGELDDFATVTPSDLRPDYYSQDVKDAAGNVTRQAGPVGTMGGAWAPQTVEELTEQGYSEEEAIAFQKEALAQAQKMFPQQFPLDMTVEEAQKQAQAQMQGMTGSGMAGIGTTGMGAGALGLNPDMQSLQWAGLPTSDYAGALPYALPSAGIPLIGDVYQDVIPKYKQAYDMAQLLGVVQADPQALAGQTGTIGFQQFMQSNPDVRGLLGSGLDAIESVKGKISSGLLPSALSDNEQFIFYNYIQGSQGNPLGGVQQELALRQSLTDYLPEAVRGAARAGLARQYQETLATNPLDLFGGQALSRFSPYQTTPPSLPLTSTPAGMPQPPMTPTTLTAPGTSMPPTPPEVTIPAESTAPPQAQQDVADIETYNEDVFKSLAPAAPTAAQYAKSPASYPNYVISNTGKVIPREGRDAQYWEQKDVLNDPAAAGLVPRYDAYDENKIIGWDRLGSDPEGIQKKVQTWVDREGNMQNRVVGGEEARLMKKSGFMDPRGINPALGVPPIATATPGNVSMQGETPQGMGVNLTRDYKMSNEDYLKWLNQGGNRSLPTVDTTVDTTQSLNEGMGLGSPTREQGTTANFLPLTLGNQVDKNYYNFLTGSYFPNLQSNAMNWRDFTGNLGFVGNTDMTPPPTYIPVDYSTNTMIPQQQLTKGFNMAPFTPSEGIGLGSPPIPLGEGGLLQTQGILDKMLATNQGAAFGQQLYPYLNPSLVR